MNKRNLWKTACGGLIVAFIVAGFSDSYRQRLQAQKLLAAIANIQVGTTTRADAQTILRPFFRFSNEYQSPSEMSTQNLDEYTFRNKFLAWMHLAPEKFFHVNIGYHDGFVIEKFAQYYEEPRCSGSISERALSAHLVGPDGQNGSGRKVYMNNSAPSPVFILKVRDDTSVPLAQRTKDWQLNLSCMTEIGACNDPRKVLEGAMF